MIKIQEWQVLQLFWFSSFLKRYILYFPRATAISSTCEIIYKSIYWIILLGLKHLIPISSDIYLSSVPWFSSSFFSMTSCCYFSLIKSKTKDVFYGRKSDFELAYSPNLLHDFLLFPPNTTWIIVWYHWKSWYTLHVQRHNARRGKLGKEIWRKVPLMAFHIGTCCNGNYKPP